MGQGDRDDHDAAVLPGRAHLVGLGGPGMLGLAQGLARRGSVVSGSHASGLPIPDPERLRSMGVHAHAGHAPRGVVPRAHLVVFDPEVSGLHPDRLSAHRAGVEQASRDEVLRRIFREQSGVAILGGRVAGMAAAMVGWTLERAGLDPTVLLETAAPQLGGWGRFGGGPHAVVELPGADPGGSEATLEAIGPKLSARIGETLARGDRGMLWGGCSAEKAGAGCEVIGLERGDDWWGADLREDRGRFRFRAFHRGSFVVEARLRAHGRRSVLGALAAVAVCGRLDVAAEDIKEGLEDFAGVSRGFESRGSVRGVTLVDDRASEPDAVAEILALSRQVFGPRRLCAAFGSEPGQAEADRLATPLARADAVLVVGRGTARDLAAILADAGVDAAWARDRGRAVEALLGRLEPGDVLLTLGSGEVGTIADALLGFR